MRRRTLYRALAVVLALAAITPLFAAGDGVRGLPRPQASGPQLR